MNIKHHDHEKGIKLMAGDVNAAIQSYSKQTETGLGMHDPISWVKMVPKEEVKLLTKLNPFRCAKISRDPLVNEIKLGF